MKHAPPPSAVGRTVFGDRLPLAQRYADMLATDGVQRGLIGPREVERLWDRHLVNSASIAAEVPQGAAVIDVGSGAGLPGVPLAIIRPDLKVTLDEPLLRRVTFLEHVVRELGLGAVDVQRARAEEMPRATSDVVVARAVAPLDRLARWTVPLLVPGGRLVAMKGDRADAELADAAQVLRRLGATSWEVRDLPLPDGSRATRAVVVVAGDGAAGR